MDSTALLSFNWVFGTPFKSRTSPLVQTKNRRFCLSSWRELLILYLRCKQVESCFLQFTSFHMDVGRLLQSSWLLEIRSQQPGVNSTAWLSWSYLVCLEVPKQWIPMNEQSSVLKPLCCHLILHYCLPWMFQL